MLHRSPYDIAWNNMLAWGGFFPDTSNALRDVFKDTDHLDERQFTPLHRIVLGLNGGDLEYQLSVSTSTIDDEDSHGRTALSWAAARGDLGYVQTLLAFGADPNICASTNGSSPLHHAALGFFDDRVDVIQALLDAGGIPDSKDLYGCTPLHCACRYGNIQRVALILSKGVDINAVDCNKLSPLHDAIEYNNFNVVKYLLDNDADIDSQDTDGGTALHICIEGNSHESLQVLLHSGPDYSLKDSHGYTVLHIAAYWGDTQTLKLLAGASMKELSLDARYKDGDTAEEVALLLRLDEPPEWWDAFYALLDSTVEGDGSSSDESSSASDASEELNAEESEDGDDEEDAVFEDAVEELS